MEEAKIPTGNERLSIPSIREADGSIQDITFLHMGIKGLIDIRGSSTQPLMKPLLILGGKACPLNNLIWKRLNHWIPQFSAQSDDLKIIGTILTPIEERGFIYRFEFINIGENTLSFTAGLEGLWSSSWHCINEDKQLDGKAHVYRSGWNEGIIFDFRYGASLFSFAPMVNLKGSMDYRQTEEGISYSIKAPIDLASGETKALDIFWGIGFEEVASATSAKEMLRQGYDFELQNTLNWLQKRSFHYDDPLVDKLFHVNLFFNFFYASGMTLDTEEMVLVTSRSPRYYVSAAYWDRDSLLWSFPSILLTDHTHARQMLDYVFTRQIKNVGVHSRYIDGTILEPGFELDELCAPILALFTYIEATGDTAFLREAHVQKGVHYILSKLMTKKHTEIDLFETFLQPTDDMHVYRYITYDNVLVWRSLLNIAKLYDGIWDSSELKGYVQLAGSVKSAIYEHCVKEVKNGSKAGAGAEDNIEDPIKRLFAWSVDLEGCYDIYDEPPGSLQLLPFYGFIDKEDETFKNTVAAIRSTDYPYSFANSPIPEIGCPHAPHPWILSLANSLLLGRVSQSLDILRKLKMDNLIACESVDENTGECMTGAAFATCAGFLAFALYKAFFKGPPKDGTSSQERTDGYR